MIEYVLIDETGNQFELSGSTIEQPAKSSLTYLEDNFSFDAKIKEKSFLDGAVKLGNVRLKSKYITLKFTRVFNNTDDYKTAQNLLLYNLRKAKYLLDKTNSRQIEIQVQDFKASYNEGAHKLMSDNTIRLKVLTPYWKDTVKTIVIQSLSISINDVNLNNLGSLEVYPIITLTAAVAVTSIEMYIDATKYGIQIDDILFGTVGYEIMIIDCEQGTILIGALDRSKYILAGSGYFPIPVGASILKIIPTAALDLKVEYYNRDYI